MTENLQIHKHGKDYGFATSSDSWTVSHTEAWAWSHTKTSREVSPQYLLHFTLLSLINGVAQKCKG